MHNEKEIAVSKHVWLIEEQPNPTTDYYLLPAFASLGWTPVRFKHSDAVPDRVPEGQTIVFVRYIPAGWIALLGRLRLENFQPILFMDDDVLDISASKGLPLRYRVKLARLSASRTPWMKRSNVKVWVSTAFLAEKYRAWNPKIILPSPVSAQDACTIFYHGSATHEAEIRWLRPIVEEVLKRVDHASFEIVGGPSVQRLYRGLSRVTVVRPMKWPAYQRFLASSSRAIGLAPVLDTQFNKARSYTKFFDITRAGAAGIYSRGSIFDAVVQDRVDGLLQDNDPQEWASSIFTLLDDAELRSRLLSGAERRMAELHKSALESYAYLC